ncbi:TRAP transporter large permease [Aquibium sp. LZ166]|uniref:TRAP transporter large permease protein n=1 Tax=Aquibium pacificus TaxID=3153579 RepID=A0ABV3SPN7_9HYPH
MSGPALGLVGIVILLGVMLTGMPIAFVFALLGFLGIAYMIGFQPALNVLALDTWEVFSSYTLTVIPLFVMMGMIAFQTGLSERLYRAGHVLFGKVRGGLAMGTVMACAAFAACCGSSPATAATIGAVSLQEMRRYNYSDALATGCVAAAGSLGILIPPSVTFVIYGIMTENSIGKLFIAGLIPGLILTALFVITVATVTFFRPDLVGPPADSSTWREKLRVTVSNSGEVVAIFVIIMGGLFLGFFTPTEAGAAGVTAIILIGLARRQLKWAGFVEAIRSTLGSTAMIMLIIAGATIFGRFLSLTQLPNVAASWVIGLDMDPSMVMLIILVIYLIGGTFMDSLALLLLTLPIFYPVSLHLGFDPLWFGVFVVIAMEMALITPPVGINVFVIKGVAKDVPLSTIFKGILPFLAAEIVMVFILLLFPQIATFLPGFM